MVSDVSSDERQEKKQKKPVVPDVQLPAIAPIGVGDLTIPGPSPATERVEEGSSSVAAVSEEAVLVKPISDVQCVHVADDSEAPVEQDEPLDFSLTQRSSMAIAVESSDEEPFEVMDSVDLDEGPDELMVEDAVSFIGFVYILCSYLKSLSRHAGASAGGSAAKLCLIEL